MNRKSGQFRYRGKIVDVSVETVSLPDGQKFELEHVWHPGGAAAVAVDGEKRVCLLRQYRPIARDWMWEVPAGKRDDGEEPLQTIQRELREEAGVTAGQWIPLGRYYSSPGIFDELIHLWLADDLSEAERDPEPHELIEVHWLDLDRAMDMVRDGQIVDGKTAIALYRAHDILNGHGS
jgi:8-oxo-dGTP pyrophosphatase MutT (NUDIX family)